jgi:uncharacterized protein
MDSNVAKASGMTVLAAGLGIGALAVVHNSQSADRQGRIVIAAGNSQYAEMATRYQEELSKLGVQVEVRRTTRVTTDGRTTLRPLEGRTTLRALSDIDSGITAGFVKGGLVGSLQGRLATDKQKGRHEEYAKLRSVGRLFHEPIWVFTRGDLPIDTLRDLKGKRIIIGTNDSGARGVARHILRANGITDNATYINEDLDEDATSLLIGSADAAFLVIAADTDKIQKLLRVPNIRLMNFAEEADAYINRFPALSKVTLRKGAVEFDPLIPSDDITLLSTSVALVVRGDMQPALVSLLTHAVVHRPKSGFDRNGDPVLFYRPGEFPSASDPEFDVPDDARVVHKSGELPFMLRLIAPINYRLGVPFAYTSFIGAHATKLVLLIPLFAVILPLFRAVPALYVWMIRRRLIYWYRQLKALEKNLDSGGAKYDAAALQAELERIDLHVRRIRVPLYFSDQLYDLRGHVDLVRQRLLARPAITRMAAE